MKKAVCFFLVFLSLVILAVGATAADREPVEKGPDYIGAMRVVRCKEYVSLREGPRKTYNRIMKVPLGAIVMNCRYAKKGFVSCEYQGEEGYILKMYLEPAPEYEPPETTAQSVVMTREEILEGAEPCLEWKEFNVSVLASHKTEAVKDNMKKEILKVGCFIDGVPTWGYIETVENKDNYKKLKAFIGGNTDEPQVMVYDAEYGLIMIDLLSGRERWTMPLSVINLGDANAIAVGEDGTIYVAGSDGPTPVAISNDGRVSWKTKIEDELGVPTEIKLNTEDIDVRYEKAGEAGYKILSLEYNGDVIGVRDMD